MEILTSLIKSLVAIEWLNSTNKALLGKWLVEILSSLMKSLVAIDGEFLGYLTILRRKLKIPL